MDSRTFKRILKKSQDYMIQANSIQERNPALKKGLIQIKFLNEVLVDFWVEYLGIGILYLSLEYHKTHPLELRKRIEVGKGWLEKNNFFHYYLCMVDDERMETTSEATKVNITALEHGMKFMIFARKDDFMNFLCGLHKRAYVIHQRR